MFKLLRNKKGQTGLEVPVALYVIAGIMAAITSTALVKTARNGVLANNAKVIACKVQNKGAQFCNDEYDHTSKAKPVVEKRGGGLRARILAAEQRNRSK